MRFIKTFLFTEKEREQKKRQMKRKEEEEKVRQRQQALEEKQKAEKALRVKQEEERLRKKRQEEEELERLLMEIGNTDSADVIIEDDDTDIMMLPDLTESKEVSVLGDLNGKVDNNIVTEEHTNMSEGIRNLEELTKEITFNNMQDFAAPKIEEKC